MVSVPSAFGCEGGIVLTGTRTAGYPNEFIFLHQCTSIENYGYAWGCGDYTNCSNTDSLFKLQIGGVQQFNISGKASSHPASTASASSASHTTACPQAKSSTNSSGGNNDAVVGAAVGVPLGILMLVGWALFFMERRKNRRRAADPRTGRSELSNTNEYGQGPQTSHFKKAPVEMATT